MSTNIDAVLEIRQSEKESHDGVEAKGLENKPATQDEPISLALGKRYREAYRQAKAIVDAGLALRVVGWIMAVVVAFAALLADEGLVIGTGLALAVFVGIGFHGLGLAISAQGQMMLANLDTATNTSPFLSDDDKAQILALGQ